MVRGKDGEQFVADDLRSKGYEVKLVNQFGFDLEARKNGKILRIEVKATEKTPSDQGFHIPHCFETEFVLDETKTKVTSFIADYLALVHSFKTGKPVISYIPKKAIDELCGRQDDSVWVKRAVVIKPKFMKSLLGSSEKLN